MPKKTKITKDMILNSAFDIVRTSGMNGLNNRSLAKKLNCSIQPIYYQFKNIKELQQELINKIEKYFYEFILTNQNDSIESYKQVGMNYIKFANCESNLFKILFMSKSDLTPEKFATKDIDDYKKIEKILKINSNIKDEDLKSFHIQMWIFTHGIACLIASGTCNLEEEQIEELLTYEFQAHMSLQKNKK